VLISIAVHLNYNAAQPCDVLLQIEAASLADQTVQSSDLKILTPHVLQRVPANAGIGERIWARADRSFECHYTAVVDVNRTAIDFSTLPQDPLPSLPGDVVTYLMPSRYCHPEKFIEIIHEQFDGLTGGPFITAVRDWIEANFSYVSGVSDAETMAHDTLRDRQGVCRDYAHVLIAIARACGVPARMASVYAPELKPQDFHAVTEVYLGGAWHLVDATGMAKPEETVFIGVGRDAGDVSFLTAYGTLDFREQYVVVARTT